MADSIPILAEETVKQVLEDVVNSTTTAKPAKTPATFEGMALAYGCIVVMAVLPVFFGAFRSVLHQKKQKVSARDETVKRKIVPKYHFQKKHNFVN